MLNTVAGSDTFRLAVMEMAAAIVNAPSVGVPGAWRSEIRGGRLVGSEGSRATPTTVTVLPETVATAVLELVHENSPVMLDDGAVKANGATLYD